MRFSARDVEGLLTAFGEWVSIDGVPRLAVWGDPYAEAAVDAVGVSTSEPIATVAMEAGADVVVGDLLRRHQKDYRVATVEPDELSTFATLRLERLSS